jgi:predicted dehydrogenase
VLKIGLIGAGRWGKVYIKTIEKNTRCFISSFLSNISEVKNLTDQSCKVFSSSRDFFDEEIHAVIIATPPNCHLEYIAMAAEKKIPLLVEKPLTANLEEAIIVREISKKTRSLIMVDHIHVFSHAFQVLKENIPSLGRIYEIETVAGNFGPYRSDVSVLWDWAPHDISMILDLLNATASDTEVLTYSKKKIDSTTFSELIDIRLNVKNIPIKISISNHIQKTRKFKVYCERGDIEYDDISIDKVTIYPSLNKSLSLDAAHHVCKVSDELPLDVVVNQFMNLVEIKSNFHESLEMGIEVVRIISSIEKSECKYL